MYRQMSLFPDSGHHYYFLPLYIDSSSLDSSKKNIIHKKFSLPKHNLNHLKYIKKNLGKDDWISGGSNFEWLRAKLDLREVFLTIDDDNKEIREEVHGISLCIETNVGGPQRGYVLKNIYPLDINDINSLDETISPYIAEDDSKLKPSMVIDLKSVFPSLFASFHENESFDINIDWNLADAAGSPIPVKLIVDYGNSRTVAVAFEATKMADADKSNLGARSRTILLDEEKFDAKLSDFADSSLSKNIVDSWFVLDKPEFDSSRFTEPKFKTIEILRKQEKNTLFSFSNFLDRFKKDKKSDILSINYRMPHMFCELSPAIIGDKANIALQRLVTTDKDVQYFLNSPKRFIWNDELRAKEGARPWYMLKKNENGDYLERRLVPFRCEMLRFLPLKDEDRFYNSDDDNERFYARGVHANPTERGIENLLPSNRSKIRYSYRDSMIWNALTIIENSYRQMQSESFRNGNNDMVRRYLSEIVLTYPPGWVDAEKKAFKKSWEYARNIFYWSRFSERSYFSDGSNLPIPKVKLDLDEAVSSQLPIIFSDIQHLGGDINRWIDLYGQFRGGRKSCRVLIMDIGGGTLDTAIVDYKNNKEARSDTTTLKPIVLYTDTSRYAGDILVKKLIEGLLLRHLLKKLGSDKKAIENFKALMLVGNSKININKTKRALYNRTIFIPIILNWLNKVGSNQYSQKGGVISTTPAKCKVNREKLQEFNSEIRKADILKGDLLPVAEEIEVNFSEVISIIEDWSLKIASSHGKLCAGFECDLVIVTGKPSELDSVQATLTRLLPILETRIIFAKGFYAGSWLPFGGNEETGTKYGGNKIVDAKLVTVTGNLLYEAANEVSLIDGWKIELGKGSKEPFRNYWFVMTGTTVNAHKVLLNPSENEGSLDITGKSIKIGRSRFLGAEIEPVYEIRFIDDNINIVDPIRIVVSRLSCNENGDLFDNEELIVSDVNGSDSDGNDIGMEQVRLSIQSSSDQYWMDDPKFKINIISEL